MPLAPEPIDPTESAIIVAVPEAEPVVERHRDRFDPAAGWGVPAHVTILYPFLEPSALSHTVVDRVRKTVGRVHRFRSTFQRTAWFGTDVLWLAPEPDDHFRLLTTALVQACPTHLPHGGTFGPDATPHLTVAEARIAERLDDLVDVERQIQPQLPIAVEVSQALLIPGSAAANSWGVVATLPLGD